MSPSRIVALVDIPGRRVEIIGFTSTPYSAAIRDAILAVSNTTSHTVLISQLNYGLAELCASSTKAVPIPCSLASPRYWPSARVVLVVCNLPARDIAAGRQGVPMVPYVDCLLFRHPRRTRVG